MNDLDTIEACARHQAWRLRTSHVLARYEDLYAEAVVVGLEASRQFDGRGSLRGYLMQTMRWRLVDYVRRVCGDWRYRGADAYLAEDRGVTGADDPEPRPYLLRRLRRIYEHLPAKQRTYFDLYAAQGFSQVEIARAAGISQSAVSQALRRVRTKLRQALLEP